MIGNTEAYKKWVATRPECVQKLAAEFPVGSVVRTPHEDGTHTDRIIIGWTEDDFLIVTKTDPAVNYDKAVAEREFLCAEHLRDNIIEIIAPEE